MAPSLVLVLLACLCGGALGQPNAPTGLTINTDDGVAVVNFNANDGSDAATTFEVTADPVALYWSRPQMQYWGNPTGPNAMVNASITAGNLLDEPARWLRWLPPAGDGCPLVTTGNCKTTPASIVTGTASNGATRTTTLRASHGSAMHNVPSTWWTNVNGLGGTRALPMINGAPVLQPQFTLGDLPQDRTVRIEAVISNFPVTYDWNRYSYSGLMLYDIDTAGRIRPIWKTGLFEWLGYLANWYLSCSSTTACSWVQQGTTFSIGGSSTTAPTPSAPWRFIVDVDPVAQTITPRHIHPTFGASSMTSWSYSPASTRSLCSFYFNNYLNTTLHGLYNVSNLRIGVFVESQSGSGSEWGLTVERMMAYEAAVPVATRTLVGATWLTGPDGIVANGAADTVLDTTRYSLTNVGSNCPYSASGLACTTRSSQADVSARLANLRAYHGHQFQLAAFMSGLSTTSNSLQNGVPVLGAEGSVFSAGLPTDEPFRIWAELTSFIVPYNWNRFSWSGLLIYDYDLQGRIRPLIKTGLYEWLGYLATYVASCSSVTACSWNQVGGTFSIGGSVTTAPTAAAPWRYSLMRDPNARTWQPRHVHPTFGDMGSNGPIISDSQLASLMGVYWTNYVNNPTYGLFNPANLRVGVFVESQSGTGNSFGFTVSRMYVTSLIEVVIAENAGHWTTLRNTAINSGTQCGFGQPNVVTQARSSVCTGQACSVNVTLPMPGSNHTISVVAVSSNGRSTAVSQQNVLSLPRLPVAGAQLWLDANSMPSWTGATGTGANQACVAGVPGACRPAVWWPDISGSGFVFGMPQTTAWRPQMKAWSVDQPYQSFVFDGVDDVFLLDRTQAARDREFEMQFTDQTGYMSSRDAETTWFLVYRPSETTSAGWSRTVFGKATGSSGAGSSYAYFSQRAPANPVGQTTTYDQTYGMFVLGDNGGRGTIIGRRWLRASTGFTPNPHAQYAAMMTMTHYRNSTGGLSATRAFRLDACEGIQVGDFNTDRCSYSDGMSPADTFTSIDGLGTNVVPWGTNGSPGQGRGAGVPTGGNVIDYSQPHNVAGTSLPAITGASNGYPLAAGVFAVGSVTAGGSPVNTYFRGQVMSLVMYRRRLSEAERRSVQEYLLNRYGQLCPAIPTPAGAIAGCSAAAGGATCIVNCNGAANPPMSRIGGSSALRCINGAWVGKLPVCGTTCATRSSPRDYATCTQRYALYDFTDGTAYPTGTMFSRLAQFDSVVPTGAQWSLLDRAWSIQSPGSLGRMLVGAPVVGTGCDPVNTGPLVLGENAPGYLDKLGPGATLVVEGTLRLLADGTQAGIAGRVQNPNNYYRVVLGQAATGANRAIVLQKVLSGSVLTLSSIPINALSSDWDLTGATPITLRMTMQRRNQVDMTQNIIVELVSVTSLTLFNVNDLSAPLTLGGAAMVVLSGRAGFAGLTVRGDCDQQGSVCQLSQGQACSWTCGNGTFAVVGSTSYSLASPYWETCDANGAMPPAAQQFACVPLPPTFPPVALNISEAALVGSTLGFVQAVPINPRHVPLYRVWPLDNWQNIVNKYGATVGQATDVFAVGACSGEVILNRAGTLNWNVKTTFGLLFQACTNGNPLSCTNASVTVTILNAPTEPYYLMDTDPGNPGSESPWIRTAPENSLPGVFVLNVAGTAQGDPITAFSPESSPLRYDIAFGNDNDMFLVNATTGHLRVAKPGLNFEVMNLYTMIVRATDTVYPTLSASVLVNVRILDRNDPPRVLTNPQYLTIEEARALSGTEVGVLDIVDEDIGETLNVSWVGVRPLQLATNVTGARVAITLATALRYPSAEDSPILVWRGLQVREVIRGRVRVTDRGNQTAFLDVEVGVIAAFTPGNLPVATAVRSPSSLGLLTRGNEVITISGQNFLTIRSGFGSVVNITLDSQENDAYPNRSYACTSPLIVDDATITCRSPHAWGSNLVVRLTYGSGRRNMAATAPLILSYQAPLLIQGLFSLGGRFSFPTDLQLGDRTNIPTTGGFMLLLSALNMGTREDAPRILRLEYGEPVPGTDRLEYTAPYVPCRNGTTYENWATPTNPNGVAGGQTRVCVMIGPGIGRWNRFQVRVGTVVSNVSAADPLNTGFDGWHITYSAPTLGRVYRPLDAIGTAPLRWDNTANVGGYSPTGANELVCMNGTNWGPMDKIPFVTFWVQNRVVHDAGVNVNANFNFTPSLDVNGRPDCYKPDPLQAHTLMCCRAPRGVSYGLRVRLQLGRWALQRTDWPPSISFSPPTITNVGGQGATLASTEGGQQIVITGANLGPSDTNWLRAIANTYLPPPYPINQGQIQTFTQSPLTLWYGPVTGNEYVARDCRVTSEQPNQITCLTAPGVGRNMLYRISVGGQFGTLRVLNGGYAPPLISSVTRLPSEPFDPELGAVPSEREYRTRGGEVIVINGRNFGPCPAGSPPCRIDADPAYFRAEYYVQLSDPRTQFNTTIGDVTRRIWYNATDCNMTIPHQQIVCNSNIGAGTDAVVRVTLAGQTSVLPSTSFNRPTITALTLEKPDGTATAVASTDGGDVLVITGSDFGPTPASTCVTAGSNTRCRGMLQSITYGATGTEYKAADWHLPAGGHNTIRVVLAPGVGQNLKVVVKVADQESLVSDVTFSYAAPVINSITPATGPTDPLPLLPVPITLRGYNFGLLNPATDLFVAFGNPEDRTLVEGVPLVSVRPDRRDPAQVAAYLAQPAPRVETVTFNLPPSAGKGRAVRLVAIDKTDANAVPVYSVPVYFNYRDPVIDTVVVEALQQYVNNSASQGVTEEYAAAAAAFSGSDLLEVRKLTIMGSDFSSVRSNTVSRLVDYGAFDDAPDSIGWVEGAPGSNMVVYKWATDRVVVLTTLSKAWMRVRIVAQQFSPPVDEITGVAAPVYLTSTSAGYQFNDLSPAIGNLVGNVGPFNTVGGDIVGFTVKNLASIAASLNVTVFVGTSTTGSACPLVYVAGDARGSLTQAVNVPAADIRPKLIMASDGGRKYFDTPIPGVDSTWTLYCRLPQGEGSSARLIVTRDGVPSSDLLISYARPAVSQIEVWRAATGLWEVLPYLPGQTAVRVPTLGTQLRVTGSNFGLCPGVLAGYHRVNMAVTGCNNTRIVQAGSTGSHSFLTFAVPEGEGTAMEFSVVAADQSSADGGQRIGFTYFAPTIATITPEGRTAGGDAIVITGSDFGVNPPFVTIGPLACLNVVRPPGALGHSRIQCTLPEGSGQGLDVIVYVAGQTNVLRGGFSYSRPVIRTVEVDGRVYNFSDPAVQWASGTAEGSYKVTLHGDNFGASDYSKHCLFVSWRGRNRGRPFTCDGVESFVGEGEIPLLALQEYQTTVTTGGVYNDTDGTTSPSTSVAVLPWSHTEVSFLFPPGVGIRELVVFVNGRIPVRPPVFRYDAPTITNELYPPTGPTVGGTRLQISGVNFGTPVLDTSTPELRRLLDNRPVAATKEEYLSQAYAPQAALAVTFGRGCVTNYLNEAGLVPSYLRACQRGIELHDNQQLTFMSAAGVGVNRTVKVTIWDVQPSAADPNVLEEVAIDSNPVFFSYEPPVALISLPRPLLMTDDSTGAFTFSVQGVNFGDLTMATVQGWTEEERAVNMTVGGVPAISADRTVAAARAGTKIDQLIVTVPKLPVGYHNLSYFVAGQPGFTSANASKAALLVACEAGPKTDYRIDDQGPHGGFFGRPGEFCAPCPVGAICVGFDERRGPRDAVDLGDHAYPIPVMGFYNLNSSDRLTSGMYDACTDDMKGNYPGRDVCIVRCDPPEACMGDNLCAPEYISKPPYFRCASCAPGFYKRATECVKCPDSPWALVIGFVLLVMFGGGLAYWLNKARINIAYIAIAIDYFQVLAIFAQSKVQWPAAIQELFHVLSAFNLNIEIVAPECIVPDLGFQRKWSFVIALPFSLQIFFGLVTLLAAGYKQLIKGQKVKLGHLGGAMMASVLMVMYVMYIYLTRNILDVYNCKPTDPPDGKTYMTAVFEECGKPGGVQLTLMPAAVIATIIYIIGYPAFVFWLLWTNRETAMEDQLLRAQGTGDDRMSNPHAYAFRKRWGRLYYQFKPDTVMWVLAIILRKFLIAATYVLFNSQPSFQLAAVFLVIFLAYSAQMRFAPYLSPQDFEDTLRDHEKKSLTDAVHARLRATLGGIGTRTKKGARKNLMSADGKVDAKALLGVLQGWLFNYNTVEQLLLFSAGTVCLMGMMFAAQNKKQNYYRDSRDSITAVVIAVVAVSIVYLAVVFVTEIVVLTGEANRKKIAAKQGKGKADEDAKVKAQAKRTATGDDFEVGDVSSATNPMFLGSKQGGGAKPATPNAGSDVEDMAANSAADAAEAADAILGMRDPPGTMELWQIYKDKYEELAASVDMLKAQIEAAPASLKGKEAEAGAE